MRPEIEPSKVNVIRQPIRAPSQVRSWLQLLRIPNVFTAVADTVMGWVAAGGAGIIEDPGRLGLVLTATMSFYAGGIVLNDVADVEIDRRERPARPLPSGRIGLSTARRVSWILLALGGLAAGILGTQSLLFGLALAASIVGYDLGAKTTWLGPPVMGACRMLNILMAMSAAGSPLGREVSSCWYLAAGIGCYVMGITWFAKHEAELSPRATLLWGSVWMIVGWWCLSRFPQGGLARRLYIIIDHDRWVWPALLALLLLPVIRRAAVAIATRRPGDVQATIKQSLLALPVLDAAIVWRFLGIPAALAVLGLKLIAMWLARSIRMT